jgi:hypothetical protein
LELVKPVMKVVTLNRRRQILLRLPYKVQLKSN